MAATLPIFLSCPTAQTLSPPPPPPPPPSFEMNVDLKSPSSDTRSKLVLRFRLDTNMSDNKNVSSVVKMIADDSGHEQSPEKMIAVDDQKSPSLSQDKPVVRFRVLDSEPDGHAIHQDSITIAGNVKESLRDLTSKPKRAICRKSFDDDLTESSSMHRKKTTKTFSLALTKEEIEKDILAMTGGRRLPRNHSKKKRPKNVQRNLDMAFPGLGLSSITPDTYKLR